MELFQVPLVPAAPWLKYDAGDVPVLVAAFALGPWKGVAVAGLKCLLFAMFHPSPETLLLGAPMNFLCGAVFALVAGAVYRFRRSREGALAALLLGALSATACLVVANLVIVPIELRLFMPHLPEVPSQVLVRTVLLTSLPFNLIKCGLNGFLVFVLYKRISTSLQAWEPRDVVPPQALPGTQLQVVRTVRKM